MGIGQVRDELLRLDSALASRDPPAVESGLMSLQGTRRTE